MSDTILLREATVQEIQLELIRRTKFNAFDGERIHASLIMLDGSIYLVYYDPRGDQSKSAIWSLRVRIRKDRQGIDILPPPEG